MNTFFLGRRWINHRRKSNSVRCNTLHIKIIELICCARRLLNVTKSHLNDRNCQHCGVKTSTVIPSFYYVFNIYLSCDNSIRSFLGNLWRVLLLGNHLKVPLRWNFRYPLLFLRFRTQQLFPRCLAKFQSVKNVRNRGFWTFISDFFSSVINFPCPKPYLRIWKNDVIFSKLLHGLEL